MVHTCRVPSRRGAGAIAGEIKRWADRSNKIQAGVVSNIGKLLAEVGLRWQTVPEAYEVVAGRGKEARHIDGFPPIRPAD
ncbi:MAG TPA: hypothetical protein VE075_01070, partial [Thermoanaerobaculia bacterium]|nr:hypothetical protein [Thermoanaerobaculia bacterium]